MLPDFQEGKDKQYFNEQLNQVLAQSQVTGPEKRQ